CGFNLGLDPPTPGNLWHPAQLSRLKRGPSPSSVSGIVPSTEATSANASWPELKNLPSFTVNPGIAPPAPAAPPRTPGSVCARVMAANANTPNEILSEPFRDTCGIHVSSELF